MSFLYPYALWGLAGLSLPIMIHMLSKREKSIVHFGSVRFLKPSESDAASSLGLSQYLLLLLRLFFLALICLLIAQPLLIDESEVVLYWVEKGILEDGDHQDLLSGIHEDANVQCFSFSKLESHDCKAFTSGWQLIDMINQQEDSIVVYTYSFLKYFKGDPININQNINWNILPYKETGQPPHQIQNNGEVTEWYVSTEADKTSVVFSSIKSESFNQNKPLALSYNSDANDSGVQLKSVIDALSGYLKFPLSWDSEDVDIEILVSDSVQESKQNSIIWIPSDDKLRVENSLNDALVLKGNLSKDNMLISNLPVVLSAHFNKVYTSLGENDFRVLDPNRFWLAEDTTTMADTQGESKRTKPLRAVWWLLVLPMFFLERYVYFKSPSS